METVEKVENCCSPFAYWITFIVDVGVR